MDQITSQSKSPGIEILRTGTHVSEDGRTVTFTAADLQAIADSYDPALAEAPLVVGHPKLDAPAYGWANKLDVTNDRLYAQPHQVEAQFAELVNAGRYKRVSPSIYLPDTPGNPKPGHLYLKHVGFLGAAAPAIKGMRAASFSEATPETGANAPVSFSMPLSGLGWTLQDLFQRFRDWLIDNNGIDAADKVIPQWQIRSIGEYTSREDDDADKTALSYAAPLAAPNPEHPMPNENTQQAANFAEREQALKTQSDDLAKREQALADREQAARREDAVDFAEQLVEDGKLLPRNKAGVIELLLALPAATALNFAEGDQTITKPAGEFLRELLSAAPQAVDYAEKSRDERAGTVNAAANFNAPAGSVVDAAGLELHRRATEYQAGHPGTSFIDAVRAVGG